VVAVASMLIALGAIAIAVYALDVARDAKSQAAIAASGNRPGAVAPSPTAKPPAATATPGATPTTPPPVFTAELTGAVVRIPAAESCASVYVDVDTLQTGVFAGHDFYVTRCQGQHTVRIDRKESAAPIASNPTPESCSAQLATARPAPEIVLQVRAGLTFCLLTSKTDAEQQGMVQHLAIVEIQSIGADQSLSAVVSTYRPPA
jgi:hypothetical protein